MLLVSVRQGLFQCRHISDNILLATELVKGYNKNHISPRWMIKVDKKAYDSIDWSFPKEVMVELGFPEMFIGWIFSCLTQSPTVF